MEVLGLLIPSSQSTCYLSSLIHMAANIALVPTLILVILDPHIAANIALVPILIYHNIWIKTYYPMFGRLGQLSWCETPGYSQDAGRPAATASCHGGCGPTVRGEREAGRGERSRGGQLPSDMGSI